MKWYIHTLSNDNFDAYTLTTSPRCPGWSTDMGYHEYGLPKELAQWICDKLNESKDECPFEMIDGDWEKKI